MKHLKKSCIYRVSVRLGEHNLKTDPDCKSEQGEDCRNTECICNETPQDFKIEEVIAHTDYNIPVAYRNDIALLRLDRPVNKTGTYLYKIINLETLGISARIYKKIFFRFHPTHLFTI